MPKLEAVEKVTGRAEYIADLARPGMLHGAILQSPTPMPAFCHDTSCGARLPGACRATGADFGDHCMGAWS
jgi:CO/xanthine dehydrogenase Mo-binding subunit